jgi:hypothetical protein
MRTLLAECGYKCGVTTIIGRSSIKDHNFFLKRLPINDYDDIQFLRAKIEGGYDWLHTIQSNFKKLKVKKLIKRL